jgi:hypothetical protein
VPRKESDAASGEIPDADRGSRPTEGSVELDVLGVADEVVEARSAEHPDLGADVGGPRVEGNVHPGQPGVVDDVDGLPAGGEEPVEPDVEEVDEPPLSDDFDFVPLDASEEPDDPPFDDSDVEPGGVVAFDPRLSVLKNPDPLNVTPTGWNTFFTGSTSPDSGWTYSVRVSSENACWTSMVSPVSTNL